MFSVNFVILGLSPCAVFCHSNFGLQILRFTTDLLIKFRQHVALLHFGYAA
jgi:hypothetical protein